MLITDGTLLLIRSRNPPAFITPLDIHYHRKPRKGEAFLFTSRYRSCNLSSVQKIRHFTDGVLVQTLNSVYVILKTQVHHV